MRLFSGENRAVLMCHTWRWENLSFWAIFWPFWPRFCPRRGRHWAMGGSTPMLWLLKNVPGSCPIHFWPETVPITHLFCTCKKYGSKRTRKNGRNGPNRVPMPKKSKKIQNPKKYVKNGYFWYFIAKTVGALFLGVSYWNTLEFGKLGTFRGLAPHCAVPRVWVWSSEMSSGSSWWF